MASLLLLVPAPARAAAPTVTIAEGKSTIVSGAAGYLPAAGVRLNPCDIVHTGPKGLVQIEIGDGGKILLGPESRLVVDVPQSGEAVVGPHFLIAGWVKITVPTREKAPPYRIDTPHFDLLTDAGVAALHVAADGGEFFVEEGRAAAIVSAGPSPARVAVAAGRTFARKSQQDRGAVSDRVKPAFVQGMPGAFRDTLPSLLGQLKAVDVKARPAPDYSPAGADEWLRDAPQLRACLFSATVHRAQESLKRLGFEVGPIDGILGPRTQAALRGYQEQRGLPPTGLLEPDTLRALEAGDRR